MTLGTTATDCSCIVMARLQKRTMALRMSRGLYDNDMNDDVVITIGVDRAGYSLAQGYPASSLKEVLELA